MTLAATSNRVSYTGNGVAVSFSFPYTYRASSDLIVIIRTIATGAESVKSISTDYTVSGVADSGTGGFSSASVIMTTAPTSAQELHIIRAVPATQSADYVSGGGVDPATLEGGLDRLSQAVQNPVDAIDRALRARRTDPVLSDMPSSITRANKVLAFDSNGQPTVSNVTLSQLESASLSAGSVTNSLLANMAQATIKGRASGAGTGSPSDLSGTEVNVILPAFTGASASVAGVKGAVPAPAAGDEGKFLRGDGAWAAGGGGGGAPTDADYLVRTANGGLSAERVVTDTTTVSWDWATAGQAKAQIVTNSVGNTQIRQSGALAVVGRSANTTGNVADIQATASSDQVLRESGGVLGFGTIATAGIANDAVTYAKLQNVSAQYRILGRTTAGAGDAEEITTSANMVSLLGSADYATARTNLGLAIGSNVQAWDADLDTFAGLSKTKGNLIVADGSAWTVLAVGTDGHLLTADSTQTSGIKWAAGTGGSGAPTTATYVTISLDAGLSAERTLAVESSVLSLTDGGANANVTVGVAANGITNAKLRQSAARSVVGRATGTTGDVADISATASTDAVLRESGGSIGFGTVATAGIANDAVTYAKMQNMSAQYTILARTSVGAGDPQELTSSSDMFALLGSATYAAARTNLGLAIGTNVQAWDADLDAMAALSPAKGNVIAGTGATWTVLTIGTDGQFLIADSTQASGLRWGSGGGGGGGAPLTAQYLTLATDVDLTQERVFTPGTGISGTDGGAGSTYTLALDINGITSDTAPFGHWLLPMYTGSTTRKVSLDALTEGLTTLSGDIASGDLLRIVDVSLGAPKSRKVTLASLLAGVNSLSTDSAPDPNADYVLSFDTSGATAVRVLHREIKPTEFISLSVSPENSWLVLSTAVTAKIGFNIPYAFTVTAVKISATMNNLITQTVTVDVRKDCTENTASQAAPVSGGTSLCSTNPTLPTGANVSTNGVVNSAVASINADSLIGVFVSVNTGTTATTSQACGLKVHLIGYRT
jgi:hypothetical protein